MHNRFHDLLCIFNVFRGYFFQEVSPEPFFPDFFRYKIALDSAEGSVWPLKEILSRILEDHSTGESFRFRVRCGICDTAYGNTPIRFSKADIVPASPQKQIIFHAVYEQELRSAKQAAIRDASQHMNVCPICKRVVCNRCFLICEDLDMCKQCATHLHEEGSPVLADVVDAEI